MDFTLQHHMEVCVKNTLKLSGTVQYNSKGKAEIWQKSCMGFRGICQQQLLYLRISHYLSEVHLGNNPFQPKE